MTDRFRPSSGSHAPFYKTKLSSTGHHTPRKPITKKKVVRVVPKKTKKGVTR